MKLSIIIILVACLQVSARGYSQTFSFKLKDASLESVFKEIRKQGKFDYLFDDVVKAGVGKITIDANGDNIHSVLEKIFKDYPFITYSIDNNLIRVLVKPDIPSTPELLLPPIDVTGKLVNEKGEPVMATVTVKGTKNAVSTDVNGFFVLKGVDENAVLVITGINVEDHEIKVAGKSNLDIIHTKTRQIVGEEVLINTGYQKIKPNEVTGSVVHIDNEKFNHIVSPDLLSRIRGAASGVVFLRGNDELTMNQKGNIVIRGYSTILSSKAPLIILDNFPYQGDITNINPNDVESITILKDAAAASIWGARAGNGVIVITTKTGRYNQKSKVSFNTNITTAGKPDLFYTPTMSPSDYIDVETMLFNQGHYDGLIGSASMPPLTPAVEILLRQRNGTISGAEATAQLNALRQFDVRNDILKYVIPRPLGQQYSLSVAGGSASQSYHLSVGYDHTRNNDLNDSRFSLNAANTNLFLNNRLEVTTGVWFSQTRREEMSGLGYRYPYARLADENGNFLQMPQYRQSYTDTAGGGLLLDWSYYPLLDRKQQDYKNTTTFYRVNVGAKYKILKGLELEARFAYEKQKGELRNFQSQATFYTRNYINLFSSINWSTRVVTRLVPLGGILDINNTDLVSQNGRIQVNYSLNVNNQHRISFIGGGEIGESEAKQNGFRYYGVTDNGGVTTVDFTNQYPLYIDGGTDLIQDGQFFEGTNNRYVSVFGNAAYVYKNRYTLSMSGRRDGSNIFGATTNNRWKPLWSVGGSWELSKEGFYKIDWLPDLKFRMSYGYSGNVNNTVAALLTMRYSSNNRWLVPSGNIRNPPNPNIRWENVAMLNMGVDFGTKGNIISGSIEYYVRHSRDLIGDNVLPPSSGSPPANRVNLADMKGRGIDITINTDNLRGQVKWTTTLLFSYSKDWVTKYKLVLPAIGEYVFSSGAFPIIGRPVSALYSYRWAGLDPSTGDPRGYLKGLVSKEYSSITASPDFNDMVYHGPQTPPYFGNLTNTVKWKDISLSVNMAYKFGYYFRRTSIDYESLFAGTDYGHTDYTLRWTKPGDEAHTDVPALVYPANIGPNQNRDLFYTLSEVLVEKGDHIRLQDIRISYDLNKQTIRKLPFANLRLYIYVSNLGVIWRANDLGLDPDFSVSKFLGVGLPPKRVSAGLKIDL